MSERKHEKKVKRVSVDDDFVYIELLSGLRLSGPLRTNPIHREPVVPAEARPVPAGEFVQPAAAT